MSSLSASRKQTSKTGTSSALFEKLLQESKAKAESLRNQCQEMQTRPVQLQDPDVVRAIVSFKISDNIVRVPSTEVVFSTPFDNKKPLEPRLPDVEQEYNSLICKIHSREVGFFEEMPPDHCLNRNCQFYVKSIRVGPPPKPAAVPASKRRKYCPLPLTTDNTQAIKNNPKKHTEKCSKEQTTTGQQKNTTHEPLKEKEVNKLIEAVCTSRETPGTTRVELAIERQVNELSDTGYTPRTRRKQKLLQKRFFISPSDELTSAIEKVDAREEMVTFAIPSDDEDGNNNIRTSTPITRSNVIKRPHEIGLANKGNTCFVNATLQSLFALKDFMDHLKVLCDEKTNVHACLCYLDDLATARGNGVPAQVDKFTTYFASSLRIIHGSYSEPRQQDATEFLSRLLEVIRNEFPGPQNPVDVHFQFQLAEIFCCTSCQSKTSRVQSNISLCLPIPDRATSLRDCLQAFLEEDERSIKCDKCGAGKTNVSYRFTTIPNTLVMSLKRYTNEGKISKEIAAPAILDLKDFIDSEISNTKIKKVAEILHIGESIDRGHFISNVLCDDGLWRKYDDDVVSTISHTLIQENTYSYFYQRMPS